MPTRRVIVWLLSVGGTDSKEFVAILRVVDFGSLAIWKKVRKDSESVVFAVGDNSGALDITEQFDTTVFLFQWVILGQLNEVR